MKYNLLVAWMLVALGATTNTTLAEGSGDNLSTDKRWGGFYWGVNVGYAAGEYFQGDGGIWGTSDKLQGFSGGATVGINKVVNLFVLGLEADIQASNIGGRMPTTANWTCIGVDLCENNIGWYGTFRTRLGKPIGNIMPFITGGLALARIHTWDDKLSGVYVNYTGHKIGWVLGAGVETILNEKTSIKFEVLHLDFGTMNGPANSLGDPYLTKNKFNVVRLGVNWKF